MSSTLSLSTTDHVVKHTIALLDRLFPPPRLINTRLWDGSELPAAGRPAFSLVH